jgi:hypothetical protein
MDIIPYDNILYILKYVDILTLKNISHSCKSLNEIINGSDIWMYCGLQYTFKKVTSRYYLNNDIVYTKKNRCKKMSIDDIKFVLLDFCKKICKECRYNIGSKYNVLDIRLCPSCKRSDKYKLICKSTVKNKYLLTDKHIDNIQCFYVKNPHYSCASSMTLYYETDIINRSNEIHVNIDEKKRLYAIKQKQKQKQKQ